MPPGPVGVCRPNPNPVSPQGGGEQLSLGDDEVVVEFYRALPDGTG